jgi:lipoprotein-anchoring transpeptidase ErfK/SrfK
LSRRNAIRLLLAGPAAVSLIHCKREKPAPPAAGPAPGPPPAVLLKPIPRLAAPNMPSLLKPGEFIWKPEAAPAGPIVMVVSIPEQRAYVYRNGVAIGLSTVSTGKKGHETPSGVFTILQKKEKHTSNIYDAPMPFMQRLTWSGIALHAGKLPGYPASHGCVRLPMKFAEAVFSATGMGTTVIVSNRGTDPDEMIYPGLLAPGGEEEAPLAPGESEWTPEKAPEGPVTLLLSREDRTLYVFRNGFAIGRCRVIIDRPLLPLGDIIFTVLEGSSGRPSPYVPGKEAIRWMAVGLSAEEDQLLREDIMKRVKIPAAFARKASDILAPGATVLVTDLASTRATTTRRDFTVMTADASDPKGANAK